ncbi:MAG: alanyl-tRNA editing protein [Treponema sp.]|jgi:alanyl-tRNA synthetase|nr:alanyl-tRNA editing protein [Treponema sp.]
MKAAYYDYFSAEPFPSKIVEIRKAGDTAALILETTIFYPEGGGQGADRGTINGAPVLDVREEGGEILHFLAASDAARLSTGTAELVLDAARRRDFTLHHTAQHLLSGTILRLFGKPTASMRLGEEVCTIDVDTPELSAEALSAAEDAAADAVEADFPVIIHLCPPEKVEDFPLRKTPPRGADVIRVVEIQSCDFSPCCGTHLKSTGPIGVLKILDAEKYKGMTRIAFAAGRRAFRDYRLLRRNGELISKALKTPIQETGKAALALLERTGQLERRVKDLEEAAALARAEALLETMLGDAGAERICASVIAGADMAETLRIGRAAQKLSSAVIILGAEKESKFAAFCSAKGADLRPLLRERLEAAGGRGGGGASFFQGAFDSSESLTAFLESFRLSG